MESFILQSFISTIFTYCIFFILAQISMLLDKVKPQLESFQEIFTLSRVKITAPQLRSKERLQFGLIALILPTT